MKLFVVIGRDSYCPTSLDFHNFCETSPLLIFPLFSQSHPRLLFPLFPQFRRLLFFIFANPICTQSRRYRCIHFSNFYSMERKAFLDQEPPPGYVAGIGRGATGFTTSADTGPVRFESDFGTELEHDDGSDAGILAVGRKTLDDDEADRIYDEIDKRMQRRHRAKPETEENGVDLIETGNGTVKHEFTQLKTQLAGISALQWENLPEVGDLTRKNKRQRILDQQLQRSYAAPDMLIAGAGGLARAGNHDLARALDTAAPNSKALMAQIHEMESQKVTGDIDRSRLILASLRRTEPGKSDLWIASARLEELAKNFKLAKALIVEGCTKVPHNENVWLESVRIHQNSSEGTKVCKSIINEALRLNTESEKLWFQAVELENPADSFSRKKILMKALEFLPQQASLWKALVDLESDTDNMKRLLNKATELCSEEWGFWLTLVNTSDYKEAKTVLNKARKQLPLNHKIWITALKLEERENPAVSSNKLLSMLAKGFKELGKHNQLPQEWLVEAAEAESEGFRSTCCAIVDNALDLVENSDSRLPTLLGNAESYAAQNSLQTSNYIYQYITKAYPGDVGSWMRLFSSFKRGSDVRLPELYGFYSLAISQNPLSEIFYLMYAKDKWIIGKDVPGARKILEDASLELPGSEKIWLARVKLEVRNSSYKNAFNVSKRALQELRSKSVRVWYKHIHLLRFCVHKGLDFSSGESLLDVCVEALELFPDNDKLFLQKSQILLDQGEQKAAREVLSIASRKCPASINVWCSLAQLDMNMGASARARSLLDTATLENPSSDLLWDSKIELEIKEKDMVIGRQLVNKALKLFPSSSLIWMHNLTMIPKMSHRKNAFLDALKQTNNSTEILLGIGVFFWIDGKFAKAKAWFDRALNADKKNGDAWGWSYCFVSKNGTEEEVSKLLEKIEASFDDINKGKTWTLVLKNHENYDMSPADTVKAVAEKLLATSV